MPVKAMSVREAAALALGIADEMHLELVDTELVKEPTGHFLRFFIDKEGGVTLSDCEAFHRKIQPLVERVDYDFMEVSSPGIDRPLKTPRDFEKAMGNRVEVRTYKPISGQKRFEGELKNWDKDTVTLATEACETVFLRKDVALIRPVVDVDEAELMRALPDEGANDNAQGGD